MKKYIILDKSRQKYSNIENVVHSEFVLSEDETESKFKEIWDMAVLYGRFNSGKIIKEDGSFIEIQSWDEFKKSL